MSKSIDTRLNKEDISITLAMLVNYRNICTVRYDITKDYFWKTQCVACSKLIKKFMFEIDKGGAK